MNEELDFGAVQRGDPEMEQKLNRVIRACIENAGKRRVKYRLTPADLIAFPFWQDAILFNQFTIKELAVMVTCSR